MPWRLRRDAKERIKIEGLGVERKRRLYRWKYSLNHGLLLQCTQNEQIDIAAEIESQYFSEFVHHWHSCPQGRQVRRPVCEARSWKWHSLSMSKQSSVPPDGMKLLVRVTAKESAFDYETPVEVQSGHFKVGPLEQSNSDLKSWNLQRRDSKPVAIGSTGGCH
jgi:hypothetical protein